VLRVIMDYGSLSKNQNTKMQSARTVYFLYGTVS